VAPLHCLHAIQPLAPYVCLAGKPNAHLPLDDYVECTTLQPVVALMVPRLISSGQKWQLYGLSAARQLQIVRGKEFCCNNLEMASMWKPMYVPGA
jgi:hypothetical protein